MTLITLQRRAPVAPAAATCRLCDASVVGGVQDHLLVGQPGTAEVRAVICTGCGDRLVRLVETFGHDLRVLVKEHQQPIALAAADRPGPDRELDVTRDRLTREADTLGRTAQTLRAEAEKLGVVKDPGA